MESGLTYDHIAELREKNRTWKLLCSDHAPFIIYFLDKAFSETALIAESELAAKLEAETAALREDYGEGFLPRQPEKYLQEWSDGRNGWLRRWLPEGKDEPYFETTLAYQNALFCIRQMERRTFVGTKSKLQTIDSLLKKILLETETDAAKRIESLRSERDALDAEIKRLEEEGAAPASPGDLLDYFEHLVQESLQLLSCFKEIEQNYQDLNDRMVGKFREEGPEEGKGRVAGALLGEDCSIQKTEQGKNFRAFVELLLSPAEKKAIIERLEAILGMEEVKRIKYDQRMPRIFDLWLENIERIQKKEREITANLNRYLSEGWRGNERRTEELARAILRKFAAAGGAAQPKGAFFTADASALNIRSPFCRPLSGPAKKRRFEAREIAAAKEPEPSLVVFGSRFVDGRRLRANLIKMLEEAAPHAVKLSDVLRRFPPSMGVEEALRYITIAQAEFETAVDESEYEAVGVEDPSGKPRMLKLPAITIKSRRPAGGKAV